MGALAARPLTTERSATDFSFLKNSLQIHPSEEGATATTASHTENLEKFGKYF